MLKILDSDSFQDGNYLKLSGKLSSLEPLIQQCCFWVIARIWRPCMVRMRKTSTAHKPDYLFVEYSVGECKKVQEKCVLYNTAMSIEPTNLKLIFFVFSFPQLKTYTKRTHLFLNLNSLLIYYQFQILIICKRHQTTTVCLGNGTIKLIVVSSAYWINCWLSMSFTP